MSDARRLSVLVVDDDEVSRALLELLLSREGYRVKTVESGDRALEHLRGEEIAAPDVVLMDLRMPGTCGSQLARELRSACGGGTRIVAISASDAHEEMLAGFDGFLRKPFAMEALARLLAGEGLVENSPKPHTEPLLDEAVCARLEASMGRERLSQLYAMLLEDTHRRIARMQEAHERSEDRVWRREAHAIKGSSGMAGALKLQSFAGSLESRGLSEEAHAELDELFAACTRLEVILVERNLLSARTSSP